MLNETVLKINHNEGKRTGTRVNQAKRCIFEVILRQKYFQELQEYVRAEKLEEIVRKMEREILLLEKSVIL